MMPAVCLVGGIAAGRLWIDFRGRDLLILISIFLALAGAARLVRSMRLALVCALLAVFFSGAWLELYRRPGAPPIIEFQPREALLLEGCVVEPPAFYQDRQQFVLELAPGARVRVNLYPRDGEAPPALDYGQRVEVEARMRNPRNFGNPGAFDYAGWLARQQIYWTASTPAGASVRILPGRCGTPAGNAVFGLRRAALERIESLYSGRPYTMGMMQALLIGEKSKVEESWTDQYRVTGTYHALVISGMHLAVLAVVIVFVLRTVLLNELIPLAAAALFGWLYACVTGWQTPVVRAAAGLTLFFAVRFLYRRQRLLNLLAAAAILFLLIDPQQLFEASFQLSFLCIAALAVFAVPFIEKTSLPYSRGLTAPFERDRDLFLPPQAAQFRVELRLLAETVFLWTRIPERWFLEIAALIGRACLYLFELVVVSASVQLVLALPMAVYFHRVAFLSVFANLAVVPLMSVAVPVGFLAVITGWKSAADVAGWLLALSEKAVDWHARLEPAWRIPDPPWWLTAGLAASLVLLALASLRRSAWRWTAGVPAAVLLALLVWHPFAPKVNSGGLELTAIDVGQGDALLVAFPDGKLMMLDAGGMPSYRNRSGGLDTGEDVVAPYLWTRSIRRLDVVAVSHLHNDHAGGVPALIRNFHPREVWMGAAPECPERARLEEAAAESGAAVRRLIAGQEFAYGGARLRVLAPPDGRLRRRAVADQDSLVLRVSLGDRSFLLTGDLHSSVERALLEEGSLDHSDVLKIPHHGSRTATSAAFLEQVRPSLALISAGFENSYGHPHPDLLARLESRRAAPLRTDVWGAITIWTDGRSFELDTARWQAGARRLLRLY